jgi:hypothetical protein
MTDSAVSNVRLQRRSLIVTALLCAAAAGAGRWFFPGWQAHPFWWLGVTGFLFILARSNGWWSPATIVRADALWPLGAVCGMATLLVVEADTQHLFGYDRFFPFLWLCCYALGLFQAGRGAAHRAGWLFFSAGILYGMSALFYPALTEYGWLYLGAALTAGHLSWAWSVRDA